MVDSLLILKSLLNPNHDGLWRLERKFNDWADFSWAEPMDEGRNWTCNCVLRAVQWVKAVHEKSLIDEDRVADGVDRQIFDLCEKIILSITEDVLASERAVTYYNNRFGRPDVRRDPREYAWNPARFDVIYNGPPRFRDIEEPWISVNLSSC